LKVLTCAAVFLLTTTDSNLLGDDTPKPLCISVNSLLVDVRSDDLSELSQAQQLNVAHYLDKLRHSNFEVPRRLHLLKDRIFKDRSLRDAKLNLTLIFPDGVCEHRCVGTAILPGPGGLRAQKFSYHKNLVMRPGAFVARGLETTPGSLVLLGENGQSLVAFYDVFNRAGLNRGLDRDQEFSRSDYSRLTPKAVGKDFRNYFACLQNVFEVSAPMPGSGAR
jgi:hypothetical protein